VNNDQQKRRDDNHPTGALTWTEPAPAAVQLVDVMVDIETLGTAPGSAILSIGAVMFGSAGMGEEFYAPISLASCTEAGLTIDPDTVAWWMKQSDAARNAAFRDDALSLAVVLGKFRDWFLEQGAEKPWCQGANFDAPLLEAAYRACGMTPPWKYWNVRDTRTLYDLLGVKVDRARGTHHNALDDARAQAETAVAALQRLQHAREPLSERPAHHFACERKGYNPLCAGCEAEAAPTQAARDVLAERCRQVEAEGWTPKHDDANGFGEMARAAACYALHDRISVNGWEAWPWATEWWKPDFGRRDLVKAGALIVAEIERLDRAAIAAAPSSAADKEGGNR
jgi:hypothetical protein